MDVDEPDFKDDAEIDPYPQYADMRMKCPVSRVVKRNGMPVYLITRYEDAKAALNDPRLSQDPRVGEATLTAAGVGHIYFGGGANTLAEHMLTSDPPNHTRLRRLVAGQFTARRTAELEPRIQQLTDELIDAFAPLGRADFMSAFAHQLPTLVIAELLGVPAEDRERFRVWSEATLLPGHDPRQREGLRAMSAHVAAVVDRKRAEPGDDLISALIQDQGEDRLSNDELLSNVKLLIIAGHETTVNLLGNGMLALLRNPDQLALLRARPELIPNAVEEMLRYDPPLERATQRYATEDIRIGDELIPQGSVVFVALASANRDEARFPAADRLDVTRSLRGHLGLGHGLHFCLGAPLARLEARIAFETLLRRLEHIELDADPDDLGHRLSSLIRGVTSLPIAFTARSSPSRADAGAGAGLPRGAEVGVGA
jgi:cytochrome P450